jgi:hypothetical protein
LQLYQSLTNISSAQVETAGLFKTQFLFFINISKFRVL